MAVVKPKRTFGMLKVTCKGPIITRELKRASASLRSIWVEFSDWRVGRLIVFKEPGGGGVIMQPFSAKDIITEEELDKLGDKVSEALKNIEI